MTMCSVHGKAMRRVEVERGKTIYQCAVCLEEQREKSNKFFGALFRDIRDDVPFGKGESGV